MCVTNSLPRRWTRRKWAPAPTDGWAPEHFWRYGEEKLLVPSTHSSLSSWSQPIHYTDSRHSRSSTCHCACDRLRRRECIRVVQRVNKYPHFKEPEVSLSFSQKPATGPYSEPVNIISSYFINVLFNINLDLGLRNSRNSSFVFKPNHFYVCLAKIRNQSISRSVSDWKENLNKQIYRLEKYVFASVLLFRQK